MDNVSIAVFIPQSHDPSGRTRANLCSSSSLLCVTNHGNGHKTYYGSRRTILRNAPINVMPAGGEAGHGVGI